MDKNVNKHIDNARLVYNKFELIESEIDLNPYIQFEKWLSFAIKDNLLEPYAMQLSTVNKEGYPNIRTVLLRELILNEGFIFYTNYDSAKANDLNVSNKACLNFFWAKHERQVRIKGIVEKISETKSDVYFNSRPFESRIGAIASMQSKVVNSRLELEECFNKLKFEYKDKTIPRPNNWGGYILKANYIEFWQGRPSRMHDRLVFELQNNIWSLKRLQP